MKKLALLSLLLLGSVGVAKADFLYGGNIQDKSISIHLSTTTAASSGAMILVDLSSTTVWQHIETGQVNISALAVSYDKLAASSCTVRLGVVTRVDASSGTVEWFYSSDSLINVSNTDISRFQNVYEPMYRLRVNGATPVTDGTTPFLVTNDISTLSTVYQSDVNLTTVANTSGPPAVGDVVMDYNKPGGATSATIVVDLQYNTSRR